VNNNLLIIIFCLSFFACQQAKKVQQSSNLNPMNPHNIIDETHQFQVNKSTNEWKQILDESSFQILRNKATERPFTSPLESNFDSGEYVCAGCGEMLFKSNQKFDSGCGWPSFFDAANKEAIVTSVDLSHGMQRLEIMCSKCGGHLGHLFNDGPQEKGGLRYCVNGKSLNFKPQK
jgi:peptide-methionine (R)-S-oxide reductase